MTETGDEIIFEPDEEEPPSKSYVERRNRYRVHIYEFDLPFLKFGDLRLNSIDITIFHTRRYRRKALKPPLKDTESDDSSSSSDDDSDEDEESEEEEVVVSSPRSTRSKDTDSGFSQVEYRD